jgi:Rnl2 family RNA ligase
MFRKYPSLTNHYMEKDLARFRRIYAKEIESGCRWQVTEKLHGANTSIFWDRLEPVKYFSRNQEITDSGFYGADELYHDTIQRMEAIHHFSIAEACDVRLFGELFGASVQKGVDYGNKKRLKFYDLVINNKQMPPKNLDILMKNLGLMHYLPYCYGVFDTLDEALAVNIERNTPECPDKHEPGENPIEGVVIKPYDIVLEDMNGSLFYIKKKGDKFKEKQSVKKAKKAAVQSAEVEKWKETFLAYIHEERLESVFSKEGRIEDIRDIGKFIGKIHADALETFEREEPDFPETFSKSEKKYIFNSSKHIVDLLKAELAKD